MLGTATESRGSPLEQICADASVPDADSADIHARRKVAALPPDVEKELSVYPKGSLMLDYGCGDGEVGVLLAAKHGFRLVQADLVDTRKDEFRNGELIQVSHEQGLAFEKGVFDIIFLSNVLQYVPDKRALLMALSAGLAERGRIIVTGSSDSTRVSRDVLKQVVAGHTELEEKVQVIL